MNDLYKNLGARWDEIRTSRTLRFKRLHPDAILPTYGSAGAAAFDVYAIDGGWADRATSLCRE